MSIDIAKLVCNPSGSSRSATLSVELLKSFLETGIIHPKNLLEDTDGLPVWVQWLKGNTHAQEATTLLMDVLPNVKGFSWAMRFTDNRVADNTAVKSPLDVVGEFLSVEQLHTVIKSLSTEEFSEVKNYPLRKSRTFGLRKMVHHNRVDLLDALVDLGWDVNIQSENGRSLLMECGSWKQAQLVLKHNPNVDVVDNSNANILDCARLWSHGEDFKEILKVINLHRTHTPNSEFEVAAQKLFEIIASQKVAELKKNLKSLTLAPNPQILEDAQQRSPLWVVCDNLRTPRNQHAHTAYARFFIRFLNAFAPVLGSHPHFGKDRPLSTVSGWSEYDHAMMTLVLNSTHHSNGFPSDLISEDLNGCLINWSKNRLPQLSSTLNSWLKMYLKDFMVHNHTTEKDVKVAVWNLCGNLRMDKLTHSQELMFSEVARLGEKSEIFQHVMEQWVEEGSSPDPFNNKNAAFTKEGVGVFACVWALNNAIQPHSKMEKALVAFAWDYLCNATVFYRRDMRKNSNSPVFKLMEHKLAECTLNHPVLASIYIEKMKERLETAKLASNMEGQDVVDRIRIFTEKMILLQEIPSNVERSCARKM